MECRSGAMHAVRASEAQAESELLIATGTANRAAQAMARAAAQPSAGHQAAGRSSLRPSGSSRHRASASAMGLRYRAGTTSTSSSAARTQHRRSWSGPNLTLPSEGSGIQLQPMAGSRAAQPVDFSSASVKAHMLTVPPWLAHLDTSSDRAISQDMTKARRDALRALATSGTAREGQADRRVRHASEALVLRLQQVIQAVHGTASPRSCGSLSFSDDVSDDDEGGSAGSGVGATAMPGPPSISPCGLCDHLWMPEHAHEQALRPCCDILRWCARVLRVEPLQGGPGFNALSLTDQALQSIAYDGVIHALLICTLADRPNPKRRSSTRKHDVPLHHPVGEVAQQWGVAMARLYATQCLAKRSASDTEGAAGLAGSSAADTPVTRAHIRRVYPHRHLLIPAALQMGAHQHDAAVLNTSIATATATDDESASSASPERPRSASRSRSASMTCHRRRTRASTEHCHDSLPGTADVVVRSMLGDLIDFVEALAPVTLGHLTHHAQRAAERQAVSQEHSARSTLPTALRVCLSKCCSVAVTDALVYQAWPALGPLFGAAAAPQLQALQRARSQLQWPLSEAALAHVAAQCDTALPASFISLLCGMARASAEPWWEAGELDMPAVEDEESKRLASAWADIRAACLSMAYSLTPCRTAGICAHALRLCSAMLAELSAVAVGRIGADALLPFTSFIALLCMPLPAGVALVAAAEALPADLASSGLGYSTVVWSGSVEAAAHVQLDSTPRPMAGSTPAAPASDPAAL